MINHNLKKILLFFSIILVFSLGYYFRSYYDLNTFLSGSPYEIYDVETLDVNVNISDSSVVYNFNDKTSRYPFSYYLNSIVPDFLSDVFIVYILFSVLIFFFAKTLTKSNLGGIIALSGFALFGENLINYTKTINTSGLSYLLITSSLFCLYKFIKTKKIYFLVTFTLLGILNAITYHTGASAMFVILLTTLFFQLVKFDFSNRFSIQFVKNNLKSVFSIIVVLLFYIFHIAKNDTHQLILIKETIFRMLDFKVIILMGLFFAILFLINKFKNIIKNNFKYLLYFSIFISVIIYFRTDYFIDLLTILKIDFYYISYITFNNYLIQIILTHVYIIYFLPDILFSNKNKFIILRGWFFGLLIIFAGLIIQGYYLRILDYSFIFSYLLMAMYWVEHVNFRKTVVSLILILVILSQFSIFNDPFSMRRYYNQVEYVSAEKVAALNLDGFVISDLRVAAILSRFDYDNVYFENGNNPLHSVIFDYPELIQDTTADYLILSEGMKKIVYSRDFPTAPATQELFDFYNENYDLIYDDGVFYVYNLNK